jgi:flagellar protein FlaG
MFNPIEPISGVTILPAEAFPGQKSNKTQEILVPVVGRKEEVRTAREEIPREEIERAIDKLNRLMGIIDKQMKFSIHEKNHRVMVKILDRETGEVLNEIPPRRIIDMLESFSDIVGVHLDKRL